MLKDAPLVKEMDIDVISIMRGSQRLTPYPSRVLLGDDVLHVRCNVETLRQLRVQEGIELKSELKFKVAEPSETLLIEAISDHHSEFKF
jgi:hypothetical protein